MMFSVATTAFVLIGIVGCAQPTHLQPDFGSAYTQAMATQADLQRSSVADSDYAISGDEGLALRQRVTEESTDTESGQAEVTQSFTVEGE